jgi:hypothetical protein
VVSCAYLKVTQRGGHLGDEVVVGAEDAQEAQLPDVGREGGQLVAGDVELPQVLAQRELLRH